MKVSSIVGSLVLVAVSTAAKIAMNQYFKSMPMPNVPINLPIGTPVQVDMSKSPLLDLMKQPNSMGGPSQFPDPSVILGRLPTANASPRSGTRGGPARSSRRAAAPQPAEGGNVTHSDAAGAHTIVVRPNQPRGGGQAGGNR